MSKAKKRRRPKKPSIIVQWAYGRYLRVSPNKLPKSESW